MIIATYTESREPPTPGDNITSNNDKVTLMFQTDGNVVLYDNDTGQALWNTGTSGRTDATSFLMQSDGNLVLYAGATFLWNAGIISPNAYLEIQDDRNLVIYSSSRVALWNTATTNGMSPCGVSGCLISH